jgi:hypothetical protein
MAVAGGCAARQGPPAPAPALCRIETSVGLDRAPQDRVFPPQYWFVLTLSGYQSSGKLARPARDCRGLPLRLAHDACGAPVEPREIDAPLTAADLHATRLDARRRLVWIEARHFADGQSEGPVALVDVEDGALSARALGVLRAYHDNVALRLVVVDGGTLLVAESERCEALRTRGEDGNRARTCDRAVRLVPLLGDRFVDAAISDERGVCVGSAALPVRASGAAADGARYQMDAQVTFAPNEITVREELSIENRDRTAPSDASFVTRMQAERHLVLRGGAIVASQPGLLDRWLATRPAAAAR